MGESEFQVDRHRPPPEEEYCPGAIKQHDQPPFSFIRKQTANDVARGLSVPLPWLLSAAIYG
ncbi:hypothetical protein C8R44DRAFT_786604 [Mycena epipterygia]|nr:hypothetical protein C8R44DRAFT_786604 [Mycena epipterygia]